jgi:dihydroorotase
MVLYLTDKTTSEVITQAYNAGVVAVKLYPVGATTNSDGGVTNINIYFFCLNILLNHCFNYTFNK